MCWSELGVGCIGFSPLAQGMLTDKYLSGMPENSRASRERLPLVRLAHRGSADADSRPERDRASRGQSLAQMALTWSLRDPRMTSTLIQRLAASDNSKTSLRALDRLDFSVAELAEIDRYAADADINI